MISFFAPVPPEAAVGLSSVTFLTGWLIGRFKSKPLRAFWVGVEDVYAAHSEEQALKLAIEDGSNYLTIDDVDEVSGLSLCHPVPDENGAELTLAQILRKTRGPGWIAGTRG